MRGMSVGDVNDRPRRASGRLVDLEGVDRGDTGVVGDDLRVGEGIGEHADELVEVPGGARGGQRPFRGGGWSGSDEQRAEREGLAVVAERAPDPLRQPLRGFSQGLAPASASAGLVVLD